MMKKTYIQPSMEVVKIYAPMLLSGSPTGSGVSEEKLDSDVDGLAREDSFWDEED